MTHYFNTLTKELVEKSTPRYLLILIYLPFFLLFTACQSPINQAQENHKSTVDKWQELIRYGESTLPEHGISITAQLSQRPIKNANAALSYQLSNIKLSEKSNLNHINLLSPWFKNKYICSPVCTQLTEYKSKTNLGSTTLLNYYFEEYQYQFYDFYVQVYQLNKKLEQLIDIQPLLIKDYLLYLVDQQKPQASLVAFVEGLNSTLTPRAYQDYLLEPKLRVGKYQPSQEGLPSISSYNSTKQEQELWQQKIEVNKENDNRQHATKNSTEVLMWQTMASDNKETLIWQKISVNTEAGNIQAKKDEATKTLFTPSFEQWKTIKSNDLSVGDLACSYQGNMFGKIIAIEESELDNIGGNKDGAVTLSLFGKAKKIHDGIIENLASGYLFNTSEQALSFEPVKGTKTFATQNISQCQFK
jgi:hypothetical protein